MKYILMVFFTIMFVGCSNNQVYLVGELEDDYNKKPYIKNYESVKSYPKDLNKYSKEL